jgi:hypothetical protein
MRGNYRIGDFAEAEAQSRARARQPVEIYKQNRQEAGRDTSPIYLAPL